MAHNSLSHTRTPRPPVPRKKDTAVAAAAAAAALAGEGDLLIDFRFITITHLGIPTPSHSDHFSNLMLSEHPKQHPKKCHNPQCGHSSATACDNWKKAAAEVALTSLRTTQLNSALNRVSHI